MTEDSVIKFFRAVSKNKIEVSQQYYGCSRGWEEGREGGRGGSDSVDTVS